MMRAAPPRPIMDDPMPITRDVALPLREVVVRASRSSGPGGQHANVTASRIEASFDVAASETLSDAQKARDRARCGPVVRAVAQDARSQARNRELALARLRDRLARALAVPRPPRDAADAGVAGAPPGGQAPGGLAQAGPATAVRRGLERATACRAARAQGRAAGPGGAREAALRRTRPASPRGERRGRYRGRSAGGGDRWGHAITAPGPTCSRLSRTRPGVRARRLHKRGSYRPSGWRTV